MNSQSEGVLKVSQNVWATQQRDWIHDSKNQGINRGKIIH